MKITVINGSPKGENSISLQTMLYLQKCFSEHNFSYIHAASKILFYENNGIDSVISTIEDADLIVFCYPVYTFLVPSQLHRFILLMKNAEIQGKLHLEGKCATQLSTSKHFYDVTAHSFIEENAGDMGLYYIPGLSADMEDLLTKKGQKQARDFLEFVSWEMERRTDADLGVHLGGHIDNVYCENSGMPAEAFYFENNTDALSSKDVVIVADCKKTDTELANMILTFKDSISRPVRIINIRSFKFSGGCLGCLRCAASGNCIYTDGFDKLLREKINNGAATVYAFNIEDHSMGARFKTYDDRQFCNGHRTVTMGSPVGYLICGDFEKEQNLKLVLKARAEVGGNYYAGEAVTNTLENQAVNIEKVKKLAERIDYALDHSYSPPSNFYGVGGMRIFRDLIYQMRGFMKQDHKFFKEHGQYDFPHKKKGTILLMYIVGAMFSSESFQKKAGSKITEGMLAPYRKVIR